MLSAATAITLPVSVATSFTPRLPVRHWTLRLRRVPDSEGFLAEAFVAEIIRSLRARCDHVQAQGAAVTLTMRPRAPLGGVLVHALAIDGVITRSTAEAILHPLFEPPSRTDAHTIARRVRARLLGRHAIGIDARAPEVTHALVPGPPLGTRPRLEVATARGGAHPHASAVALRLARPLAAGTTHAFVSAAGLLGSLRAALGPAVHTSPVGIGCHGLTW